MSDSASANERFSEFLRNYAGVWRRSGRLANEPVRRPADVGRGNFARGRPLGPKI